MQYGWQEREKKKEKRKSFANGLWETANPVMCFGDGDGVWKSDSESEGERETGEKEGVGDFR